MTITKNYHLARAYQLFRRLALRHLIVVDDQHKVVGMITRKDLLKTLPDQDDEDDEIADDGSDNGFQLTQSFRGSIYDSPSSKLPFGLSPA
jgi:Mg/Co/Ni transporter MgtE